MIFGHLAVSALLHRYLKADLTSVMAAGVVPDVVDKGLRYGLRLTPSGRMFGHTLLGLALSTAVVWGVWGRRAARGWALGYLGHLMADLGGFVPWMYPFAEYDFSGEEPGLLQIVRQAMANPVELGIESAVLIWAACALKGRSRSSNTFLAASIHRDEGGVLVEAKARD